jgi:hypothetical protein
MGTVRDDLMQLLCNVPQRWAANPRFAEGDAAE